MFLSELKNNECGTIDSILGEEKLCKRLMALGCTPGTKIKLKRRAPFGDPIIITVRGFDIALRKKDANSIKIS